jgi:hypothetical protein
MMLRSMHWQRADLRSEAHHDVEPDERRSLST